MCYYLLGVIWLLQLNWLLLAACDDHCVTNLTKASVDEYARQASPPFEGLTRAIQTSLPNVPIGQVNALIEPIRQKAYDAVHGEVVKGLHLTSAKKANHSGSMNLTSEKLASGVLQVACMVLNETLSAVSKTIAALEASNKRPPGVIPSTPPANTPPDQTPGRPFAVSTIPSKAPGAPKLPPKESHEILTPRDSSAPAVSDAQEVGRPRALSFRPPSADFRPIPEPTSQDRCAIKFIKHIVCLRNLPYASDIHKRGSIATSKSPMSTLLSSHYGQAFSSISKRSLLTDQQIPKGISRIYMLTSILVKSPSDEVTSEKSPPEAPDPFDHEIDSQNVQLSINPSQTKFLQLESGKESESRRHVERILRDTVRLLDARFETNRGLLREHVAPSSE
ncbi:uncharacterized protein PGTG_17067 [Puccinia graminis f. sp. tritici CRL 75-36-700-3]|uniref:Uncharacterized protein n=1 Tax=Puccinia graminis f. sp. tritici (strain CRL 75-36-700-3 / race SCCL) TaxID=418459 RepID=E3L2U3_PUCGT|nr:uncharacterized protein PGTG_17067 [Puccinia graminis f. sp. tritici CRL 75-36-700-3]EFP90868.1 hypothetical protein PGTG_17067 [Puccinia graminis f. sp. tritici CRL 75-36-700-3]